jgi:hypothetical protein
MKNHLTEVESAKFAGIKDAVPFTWMSAPNGGVYLNDGFTIFSLPRIGLLLELLYVIRIECYRIVNPFRLKLL